MKKHFKGNRYDFDVILENSEDNYFIFEITATCKFSKKYSCINSLNAILSEYSMCEDDPNFGESDWVLTEKQAKKYMKIAQSVFDSPDSAYFKYLENRLDEDRECGEWENIHS